MSVFKSLFGLSSKSKVDDSVDNLFSKSTGPVKKDLLVKERTVLPEIQRAEETKQDEHDAEDDSESEGSDVSSEGDSAEAAQHSDDSTDAVKNEKKKKKSSEQGDDLEARYFQKLLKDPKGEDGDSEVVTEDKESDDKESMIVDDQKNGTDSQKSSTAKTVDTKEEELKKAECTVFVGNVTSSVITSNKVYKRFKKLFGGFGKVQSIRFRSISFDEALPRKVAFARKSLHSARDTINAYVVFEEKDASRKAAAKLNASTFEHFHIRVDHVAHPSPRDNKRTIFVGNLDFEQKEEELWRYFNLHTDEDVESVRVVRDSKTNLGKGFALVQFKDTLSVNKCLLLNDKTLSEDSKRKLRISRAKSNAKPSVLSPNHFDNMKRNKGPRGPQARLTDKQKTLIGRSNAVLGKADRATAGKAKVVIEGERAKKSNKTKIRNGKIVKKKPRIRERSTRYKQEVSQAPQKSNTKPRKDASAVRETRAPKKPRK